MNRIRVLIFTTEDNENTQGHAPDCSTKGLVPEHLVCLRHQVWSSDEILGIKSAAILFKALIELINSHLSSRRDNEQRVVGRAKSCSSLRKIWGRLCSKYLRRSSKVTPAAASVRRSWRVVAWGIISKSHLPDVSLRVQESCCGQRNWVMWLLNKFEVERKATRT